MLEVRFFGIERLTQFSREADLHLCRHADAPTPAPRSTSTASTMITTSNFAITPGDLAVALVVTRGKIGVCVALVTKCALGNASRFIGADAE